jgi:hypothetical protein
MATVGGIMTAPVRLTRFEYDLVRILRFLVGALPAPQVANALLARRPAPAGLSPDCIRLVQSTLRTSVVRFLVDGGGWRHESFLHDGRPVIGRAWERIPLPERTLQFSARPLAFLIWLTAERPAMAPDAWAGTNTVPTAADQLFWTMALPRLKAFPDHWAAVRTSSLWVSNPLARLAYAEDFDAPADDLSLFVVNPWPAYLECLQSWLRDRFVAMDEGKARQTDAKLLRHAGDMETAAIHSYLTVLKAVGRWDLARALLHAVAACLDRDATAEGRIQSLSEAMPTRLADKIALEKAAWAIPAAIVPLADWDRVARTIRYTDDEYAAAQWWKAEFEAYDGRSRVAVVERHLRRIDPLTRTES